MIQKAFEVLFWCSAGAIAYTYFLYPVFLFLLGLTVGKKVRRGFSEPFVSVILSVFNEEKMIREKIENLLSLDYPRGKFEILIGSDGASDRTDEIISSFRAPQVRFFRFVANFGKPNVLRALVQEAKGSVIVFTDARQAFDPKAVRALVENFHDGSVGCVSGELCFPPANGAESTGKGMDRYWSYEKFLREKESQIGSMLGATGAIYAIRKDLFPDLPKNILVDDMYIPLSIIGRGYRAVFEREARAYEKRLSKSGAEEMTRKVRTLAGNYQIFSYFPDLFIPFKSPIAWQLFSHKFLRLLVPFFLLVLLGSNLFLLGSPLYAFFFVCQAVFYFLAFLEMKKEKKPARAGRGIGYIPYTFCLLNFSAFLGLVRFLRGNPNASWEKAYA